MLTLVITVAPLRRFLIKHRWPSPLASLVSLLAIYALLIVILGSVVWSVFKLVEKLPDYANAFNRIFQSLLGVADRLGYGQEQIQKLAGTFQLSSLAAPAQTLLSGVTGFGSLLVLIVAVVIFMAFDQADIGAAARDHPPDAAPHRRRPARTSPAGCASTGSSPRSSA